MPDSTEDKDALDAKLKEQTHLLRHSIDAFYAADLVQSLNIAVRLRVLVHQTASSAALLGQLRREYLDLPISAKVLGLDADMAAIASGATVSRNAAGFRLSTDGGVAPFSDLTSPSYQLVPLREWWDGVCLIFPDGPRSHAIFTRRELILALANKEGGTHVDLNLSEKYEKLVTDSPVRVFSVGQESDSVNLSRYIAGQSGVEMLDHLQRHYGM